jgi:hypothetical protein
VIGDEKGIGNVTGKGERISSDKGNVLSLHEVATYTKISNG